MKKKSTKKAANSINWDTLSEQDQERLWFYDLAQTTKGMGIAYRLWMRAREHRDMAFEMLERLQQLLPADELARLQQLKKKEDRRNAEIRKNSPKGGAVIKARAAVFRKEAERFIEQRLQENPRLKIEELAKEIQPKSWASKKKDKEEVRTIRQLRRDIGPIYKSVNSKLRKQNLYAA